MAGRISGIGMKPRGPQVPMPEADPAYWQQQEAELELQRRKQDMENAGKVYAEMQRELRTYGHTLDDPQGARLTANTQEGLGPIALQRKVAGDIAPGKQPGSGDRRRMAAGVSKASKARLKVASALHSVIDPANEAIDYYAGPHLGSALGRSAEAANYIAGATPGLGDAMQLGQAGADYVDAMGAGDGWGAAEALGMGTVGAIFLPMSTPGAPRDMWELAQKMEQAGASPEEIWAATSKGGKPGIWRAPDGRWRWELDDSGAKLTSKGQHLAKSERNARGDLPMEPLGTLWDHPKLYAEEPRARGAMARIVEDGGSSGEFNPLSTEMTAMGPREVNVAFADAYRRAGMEPPKELNRVVGHEAQHLVSNLNDLPTGSMPGDLDHNYVRDLIAAQGGMQPSDHSIYLASSDEALARLTDGRMKYPPESRAAMPPSIEMDVPGNKQWVRETDGSIWVPGPDGQRIDLSGPRPGWMTMASASQGRSGGQGVAFREQGATPVPATNGPRQRRPQGFGGNGGPNADELLQQAISTPRKVSQRGTYVGAPPGVNTPEAEQALVDDLMSRLQGYQGTGERFYDDFQNAIRANTEDPVMARRFVSSSGHTSNQMSPLPNTTHAAKAMNQYAVGDPVLAGLYPNTSGPKAAESMAADQLSPDPKTGQYGYGLLPPEMRPANYADYAWGGERAVRGRAVHDTWDKEAFGYARNAEGKHSAASDTEHLFMDRIYNQLVHRVSRNPELRARYGTGPQAYERIQAALWDIARGNADKFDVLPADEIIRRHMGITQMAAIPGPSTGVDSALLNAPLDVKRQYTDDMFNALSTEGGRNIPAASLGFTPPMEEGFGPWQGMKEPNRSIGFMSGATGSGADKAIDPASATAARTMRNWNQFILGQEGSGFTYPSDAGATRKASDLVTIGGVKMDSPEAYDKAMKAVEEVYGPQWADNVVVQPVPGTGELMLKNISGGNNQEFGKMAQGVSKRMHGGKISGLRDIGNDFTFVQFNDPSYRTLMDETRNNPVLKKTFDEKVLPHLSKVQAESERWAKNMGLPAETVPDRVRRIFIAAGVNWPQAMDEAVKKGIIPAFAGAALLGGAANQFGGEEGIQ